MFEPVQELANINAPVLPFVLALAFRLSVYVDTSEDVTISEEI